MFINGLELNAQIFIDDLPRMLPTKSWFIWQSGFREEDLTRTVSDLTEWYRPACIKLQYYDVQTLEYRYISKLWTDMELCQGDNIPSPK
jgi:hypothetical protein